MPNHSHYDKKNNVIHTDLTGLYLTYGSMKEAFDEVITIAKSLPKKVFLVVCWKDVRMDPEVTAKYAELSVDLLQHVLGIVRYAATNAFTSVTIRATVVKQHLQGSRSYIFSSFEEAIQVVRQREKELFTP